MADKIKMRRGEFPDLPDLDEGEFGLSTDIGSLYIGNPDGNGNILINPVKESVDGYSIDGYLSPTVDNVHGLGTPDKRWHHVIVGPGSVHFRSLPSETTIERNWKIGIDDAGKLSFNADGYVAYAINPTGGLDNVSISGFSSGDGSATSPAFTFISDPNTGVYRSGENELSISTDGNQRLYVDDSGDLVIVAGNVEVSGTANPNVYFTSSTGPQWIVGPFNGNWRVRNSDVGANPFTINSDAPSNSIRIRSNGVGIGIVTPEAKLHVDGDGYFDGYLNPYVDNVYGLGSLDKRWGTISVGPDSLHIIAKATDPGHTEDVDFVWTVDQVDRKLKLLDNGVPVAEFNAASGASFPAGGGGGGGTPGGSDGQIQYNNSGSFGGDASLTWDDTDSLFAVTSATYPVSTFTRTSSITSNIRQAAVFKHITSANMSNGFGAGFDFYLEDATASNTVATIAAMRSEGYDSCSRLAFYTLNFGSPVEGMTVAYNGWVGIGTTDPGRTLEVSGSAARLRIDMIGANDPFLEFCIDGAQKCMVGLDNSDSDKFQITSTVFGADAWFTINRTTGYIGMGTNSPSQILHIKSTTPVIRLEDETGSADDYDISNTDGVFKIRNITDARDDFAIDGSGNVGIGPTPPSEKLSVDGVLSLAEVAAPSFTSGYGKIYAKSSDSKLYFRDGYDGTEYDLTGGGGTPGGSDGQIQYNNGGSFGGAAQLYYDDVNNRVGIGTSSPDYKLQVDGYSWLDGGMAVIGDAGVTGQLNVGSLVANSYAYITNPTYTASLNIKTYWEGNTGATINLFHARGTESSPSVLDTSDTMGDINFDAWDGSAWVNSARITGRTDGATSSGIVPSELRFSMSDTSGVRENRFFMHYYGHFDIQETGDTRTPDPGYGAIYVDTNGILYFKNDSGVGSQLSGRGTGDTGKVAYWSGTNTLTYDTGFSWVEASNYLGIGSVTPLTNIHIRTNLPAIRFEDANDGGDVFQIQNDAGTFSIENITDARSDLTIDGDGLVGINTSSPVTRLHVVGSPGFWWHTDTPTSAAGLNLYRSRNTEASPTAVQSGDTVGHLSWRAYNTNAAYALGARIKADATEQWTASTSGTAITFQACPTGTSSFTDIMTLKDGNVGINTTPLNNSKLSVAGITLSAAPGVVIYGSSTNTTLASDYLTLEMRNTSATAGNYNKFSFVNSNGSETSGIAGVHTAHGSPTTSSGELVFLTRPLGAAVAERMRIDADGNVGIGTDSPSMPLHVYGNEVIPANFKRLTSSTTGTVSATVFNAETSGDMVDSFGPQLLFSIKDDSGNGSIGTIKVMRDGADNSGKIALGTYNAGVLNDHLIIDHSGNVGIGTDATSPATLLDVHQNTDGQVLSRVYNASTGTSAIAGSYVLNNAGYSFLTRVYGSNNVGTAYGQTMTNGVLLNGDVAKIVIGSNTVGAPIMFATTDTGPSSAVRMTIQGNGQVGIGVSPSAVLHVREGTALGGTSGNYQLISRTEGETNTNEMHRSQYLYRDATGTGWTTARWHDSIGVDSSYVTPRSNTKCWWERDPNNDRQEWGTGASAYMTLTSSILYAPMWIYGEAIASGLTAGALYFSGGSNLNNGSNIELYGDSHANAGHAHYDAGQHYFRSQDGATTVLFVEDSGNVGIGTTTPDYTLQVDGYIVPEVDNVHNLGTPDLRWQDIYLGPSSLKVISKDTDPGSPPNKTFKFEIDEVGRMGISDGTNTLARFDTTTGVTFPQGAINLYARDAYAAGDIGEIQFNSGDGYLDASEDLFWDDINGRLGIGTKSPSKALHVIGDTNVSGLLTSGTFGAGNTDITGTLDVSSDVSILGDLGIGIASPSANMHLYSTSDTMLRVETSSITNDAQVAFYQSGASRGSIGWDDSDVALKISPSTLSSSYAISVKTDGDVGIGTNLPETKLHVYLSDSGVTPYTFANGLFIESSTSTGIQIGTGLTGSGYICFGDSDNSYRGIISYSHLSDTMSVGAGGLVCWYANSTGLGVKRTPTTYELEVNGYAGKTSAGTTWLTISDISEKKDVCSLIDHDGYDNDGYTALERLSYLRGVLYKWISPEEHGLDAYADAYSVGLISQEVEEYFPEWIVEDGEGKKWLNMIGFEAYLVEALKEIKQELEDQRAKLDDHEARLKALEGS